MTAGCVACGHGSGSDPDSAEGALSHLAAGLRAFGFSGRIAVEDATYVGVVQRYEVDGF